MELDFVTIMDYTGTFVFAISGVMAGVDRKFDLFGVFILGFVTAVGGGTLRDLLIGSTPVSWMANEIYVYLIASAVPVCFLAKNFILRMKKSVFLFDTIGIGLFTILGLQKTLAMGLSPFIAVMMGVVSAVFGGVIRDVLSNRAPLIFRKEIYAFACLAGALLYLACTQVFHENVSLIVAVGAVIAIRILAIRYHWSLPFNP